MDLSVVLPAYNEEARIERGLDAVLAFLSDDGIGGEVLVVDDGSADRTAELVRARAAEDSRLRLIELPENRGKGAAVRTGMLAAEGEFVLFTDVDQSTPIQEWRRLRASFDAGNDVVIGSREVAGARRIVPQPWYRRAMGYVFMELRGLLVLPGFIDTQCGFKAFRRAAAQEVFSRSRLDGFCFDVELLVVALHRGYSVAEVPIAWTDDPGSKVNPLLDPLLMLRDLVRIRLNRARGAYGAPVAR